MIINWIDGLSPQNKSSDDFIGRGNLCQNNQFEL